MSNAPIAGSFRAPSILACEIMEADRARGLPMERRFPADVELL